MGTPSNALLRLNLNLLIRPDPIHCIGGKTQYRGIETFPFPPSLASPRSSPYPYPPNPFLSLTLNRHEQKPNQTQTKNKPRKTHTNYFHKNGNENYKSKRPIGKKCLNKAILDKKSPKLPLNLLCVEHGAMRLHIHGDFIGEK